jgi:hypothetical protein
MSAPVDGVVVLTPRVPPAFSVEAALDDDEVLMPSEPLAPVVVVVVVTVTVEVTGLVTVVVTGLVSVVVTGLVTVVVTGLVTVVVVPWVVVSVDVVPWVVVSVDVVGAVVVTVVVTGVLVVSVTVTVVPAVVVSVVVTGLVSVDVVPWVVVSVDVVPWVVVSVDVVPWVVVAVEVVPVVVVPVVVVAVEVVPVVVVTGLVVVVVVVVDTHTPVTSKNSVLSPSDVPLSSVTVAYASSRTDPAGAETTAFCPAGGPVTVAGSVPVSNTAVTDVKVLPSPPLSPSLSPWGRTKTQPSVVELAVSPKLPQSLPTPAVDAVVPSKLSLTHASPDGTRVSVAQVAIVAWPTTLVMVPTPAVPRPMNARPAIPMAAPAILVPGPLPRMSPNLITFLSPFVRTQPGPPSLDGIGTLAALSFKRHQRHSDGLVRGA